MSDMNKTPEDRFLDNLFIMAGQGLETDEKKIEELSSSHIHLTDEDKQELKVLPPDLADQIAIGAYAGPEQYESADKVSLNSFASGNSQIDTRKQQLSFTKNRRAWLRGLAITGGVSALATAAAVLLAVLLSGDPTIDPPGERDTVNSKGPADLPPVDLADNQPDSQNIDKTPPQNLPEMAKMQHPYDLPMEDAPDFGPVPLQDLPVAVIAFEGD